MFIALDLETTGLNPEKDKIIEFGAIKFDLNYFKNPSTPPEKLQILINPGAPLPHIITHITSISDNDLKDAPPFEEAKEEIENFIGDLPIMGHNIKFDTDFLRNNGIELNNHEYDTLDLATLILPNLNSYSLEVLSQLFNLKHEEKHRALDDAIASAELFLKLAEKFKNLNPDLKGNIKNLLEKSQWHLKPLLTDLLNIPTDKEQKASTQTKSPSNYPQSSEAKNPEREQFISHLFQTSDHEIFEKTPPYKELIKQAAAEAPPEAYISLPSNIFYEVEPEIPDTIAKIDLPKNYISPQRLEEFSQTPAFGDHEISALIKYLIWLETTETGLLREVRLIGEEKNTLNKVNIDKHLTPPEEEPFYKKALNKDKDTAAICTHAYLTENFETLAEQNPSPIAILVDLENFYQTLSRKHSAYISLEQMEQTLKNLKHAEPTFKVMETLLSKAEILFGLIGMIFEKHNDANQYSQTCTISEHLYTDKNWTSVQNSISNILELSFELGEIKSPKTQASLDEWKIILTNLNRIFNNPDTENNLIWMEKDYNGNLVVRKIPTNIKEEMNNFLQSIPTCKFIGGSMDITDNGDFIKKTFDMPSEVRFYPKKTQNDNLEIIIVEDIDERDGNQIPRLFIDYFSKKDENSAIICNSKKQLEYFTLKLGRNQVPTISQTTGSISKVNSQFQQNPVSPVLLTPFGWKDFIDHEKIETLFIHKIPFDPPSNPFVIAASKNFEDPFNEFQIPRAILHLKKSISLLSTQNPQKHKKVVILDPRITTKKYGDRFMEALKSTSPNVYTTPLHKI